MTQYGVKNRKTRAVTINIHISFQLFLNPTDSTANQNIAWPSRYYQPAVLGYTTSVTSLATSAASSSSPLSPKLPFPRCEVLVDENEKNMRSPKRLKILT